MKRVGKAGLLLLVVFSSAAVYAGGIDRIIERYQAQGAEAANPDSGQAMWERGFNPKGDGDTRKCTTCHGSDLSKNGKHKRTGKVIEPMAPSVNNERFTDPRKVEKWFKRNCKWTIGRECTAQEKADFLAFLGRQ